MIDWYSAIGQSLRHHYGSHGCILTESWTVEPGVMELCCMVNDTLQKGSNDVVSEVCSVLAGTYRAKVITDMLFERKVLVYDAQVLLCVVYVTTVSLDKLRNACGPEKNVVDYIGSAAGKENISWLPSLTRRCLIGPCTLRYIETALNSRCGEGTYELVSRVLSTVAVTLQRARVLADHSTSSMVDSLGFPSLLSIAVMLANVALEDHANGRVPHTHLSLYARFFEVYASWAWNDMPTSRIIDSKNPSTSGSATHAGARSGRSRDDVMGITGLSGPESRSSSVESVPQRPLTRSKAVMDSYWQTTSDAGRMSGRIVDLRSIGAPQEEQVYSQSQLYDLIDPMVVLAPVDLSPDDGRKPTNLCFYVPEMCRRVWCDAVVYISNIIGPADSQVERKSLHECSRIFPLDEFHTRVANVQAHVERGVAPMYAWLGESPSIVPRRHSLPTRVVRFEIKSSDFGVASVVYSALSSCIPRAIQSIQTEPGIWIKPACTRRVSQHFHTICVQLGIWHLSNGAGYDDCLVPAAPSIVDDKSSSASLSENSPLDLARLVVEVSRLTHFLVKKKCDYHTSLKGKFSFKASIQRPRDR